MSTTIYRRSKNYKEWDLWLIVIMWWLGDYKSNPIPSKDNLWIRIGRLHLYLNNIVSYRIATAIKFFRQDLLRGLEKDMPIKNKIKTIMYNMHRMVNLEIKYREYSQGIRLIHKGIRFLISLSNYFYLYRNGFYIIIESNADSSINEGSLYWNGKRIKTTPNLMETDGVWEIDDKKNV